MIDTILDFHEFLDVSRVFSFASFVSVVAKDCDFVDVWWLFDTFRMDELWAFHVT